ncbi:hypothetical protein H6F51_01810 [Cyanobacteria bacterium FACHB-DQ100]|nr:hypothetical protein [Cyanobacteria bacterium FACHB-DQ100]
MVLLGEFATVDNTHREADRTPEKNQRAYYSGKKRKHTLKAQIVVNQAIGQIIRTAFGKCSLYFDSLSQV